MIAPAPVEAPIRSVRSVLHGFVVAFATIIGAVSALVAAIFDRTGDAVLVLARIWSRVVLATGGVVVTVRHHGALDARQPYVFVSNHLSSVDIWALFVAIPVNVRMIAKKQLRRIPLFGWAMAAGRFIFIDRANPVAARRSIAAAAARVRGGSSVIIFAEGTRSRDGRLLPFKKGGFHLALDAGVPIVPVAISGSREVMPRRSLLMRPGRVTIEIGTPVPTAGLGPEDRDALRIAVRRQIAAMSGQALADDAEPATPVNAAAPAAAEPSPAK